MKENELGAYVEIVGADFKKFLKDEAVWREDTTWDDARIGVNGVFSDDHDFDAVADDAVLRVESGFLESAPEGVPTDLIDCLEWWLSRQKCVRLVITVPKAVEDEVLKALAGFGVVVAGRG